MEEELYTGSSMGMKNLAKIIEGYGEIKSTDTSSYLQELDKITEDPAIQPLPPKIKEQKKETLDVLKNKLGIL